MALPFNGPDPLVLATLRGARDPHTYLADARRRLGDPFWTWLAGRRILLTGEPERVRQIFAADHEVVGAFAPGHLTSLLGQHSLILLTGPTHQRERKLLSPPFHGARMRSYARIIRASALKLARAWPVGATRPVQSLTQEISLDVIVKAVFGVLEEPRATTVAATLSAAMEALWPASIMIRALQRDLGPLTPWARYARRKRAADALVHEEIAARRRSPGGDDILALLLAARYEDGAPMSDDQLHDELITLLVAGHETTAIALAWAMYWLHRHPDALERLRAELAPLGDDPDPEAVARLPFLEAVCHETLRLFPILPLAPRTLLQPFTLAEQALPAGTHIGACTVLVHRHPELYPDPDEFRPERFLARKFSAAEFTPFGGGIRRCIGAAFALYEMKLVLAALLPGHRFRLDEPRPVRPQRRNLTLGPRGGVRMTLTERTG